VSSAIPVNSRFPAIGTLDPNAYEKLVASHGVGPETDTPGKRSRIGDRTPVRRPEILGIVVHHDETPHSDHYGAIVIPEVAAAKFLQRIDLMPWRKKRFWVCRVFGVDVTVTRRVFADTDRIK